jgi:hypothetical protein
MDLLALITARLIFAGCANKGKGFGDKGIDRCDEKGTRCTGQVAITINGMPEVYDTRYKGGNKITVKIQGFGV